MQEVQNKLPSLDFKTCIVPGTGNPYIGPIIRFDPGTKPTVIPGQQQRLFLNLYCMTRYWFEFDFKNYVSVPYGVIMGCGITAYNYEDAKTILKSKVFTTSPLPEILRLIEDVDLRNLDQNHVLLNIGPVIQRGVWFPLGYALSGICFFSYCSSSISFL